MWWGTCLVVAIQLLALAWGNIFPDFLNAITNDFVLQLHRRFESARLERLRRSNNDESLNGAVREYFEVRVQDKWKDFNDSTCWTVCFTDSGPWLLYGTSNHVHMVHPDESNNPRTSVYSPNPPQKIRAFESYNHFYVCVLYLDENGEKHYIQIYKLDSRKNKLLDWQLILANGQVDMDLVINENGIPYLLVSLFDTWTSDQIRSKTNEGTLTLYLWKNTQFDVIDTQRIVAGKSVVAWIMDKFLYAAVAQDDPKYGSRIYRLHKDTLFYHQFLNVTSVAKVAHFRSGDSDYLVFTSKEKATIFWWSGEHFLEYDVIRKPGVLEVAAITLHNKEGLICLGFEDKVEFLKEQEKPKYETHYVFPLPVKGAKLISLELFRWGHYGENYYLALAYWEELPSGLPGKISSYIFKLNLVKKFGEAEVRSEPLTDCLYNLEALLERQIEEMQRLHSELTNLWRVDKEDQYITAPLVVKGVTTMNGRKSNVENIVIYTDNDASANMTSLKSNLFRQQQALETINMENIAFPADPLILKGPLNFTSLRAARVTVGGILSNDPKILNVPLSRLKTSTLQETPWPQVFHSSLTVKNLEVNTLEVAKKLGGLIFEDVVLLNKPGQVLSEVTFEDLTIGGNLHLDPASRFNGLDPRDIITTEWNTADRIVHGLKTFKSMRVRGILDIRIMNDESFQDFANRVISSLDHDDVIEEGFAFVSPVEVRGVLKINGMINNFINLTRLHENTLKYSGDQVVIGINEFHGPVMVKNVEVEGKINGIDFDVDLATTTGNQDLLGSLTFSQPITFKDNLLPYLVNGLDLSEQAVLKYEKAKLKGHKYFVGDLVVKGDVNIDPGATLNTLRLEDFAHQTLDTSGLVVLDNMFVHGDVVILQNINGVDLHQLDQDIWRKSPLNVQINVPVYFPGPVSVDDGEVELKTLNGLDPVRDLLHSTGDEIVEGEMVFEGNLQVGSITLEPGIAINYVDISEVEQMVLRREGDQSIPGHVSFKSLKVLGNVTVEETVNGVKMSRDLMIADRPQNVTGHMTLEYPLTTVHGSVWAPHVVVDYTVNGKDFSEFYSDIVRVDGGSGKPIEDKSFKEGLSVEVLHTSGATVNGVDLQDLETGMLTLDTDQLITAPLFIKGELVFRHLTARYVNGLDLNSYLERVARTDRSHPITGKLTIYGDLVVHGDINVGGAVNEIDLRDLAYRAMSISHPNQVLAPMIIDSNVAFNDLIIDRTGMLDGVHLSDVAFNTDELRFPQVILKGNTNFKNSIYVDKINGCNISKMMEEAVYVYKDWQYIEGPLLLPSLDVTGNLTAPIINDIDVVGLRQSIIKIDGDETMEAPVNFARGLTVRDLTLHGRVNDVDIDNLMKNAVLKSEVWSPIFGRKTFNSVTILGSLKVDGNMDAALVDGVDVVNLVATTVRTYGDQTISGFLLFSRGVTAPNVLLEGTLNHLLIPDDLVLAHEGGELQHQTVILAPSQSTKLAVSGTVDGLDLGNIANDRVSLSEDWVTPANITFIENVNVFDDALFKGYVNNVNLSKAITKSGNFTMGGTKTFLRDVDIKGNLEVEWINNVNLLHLNETIVHWDHHDSVPISIPFYTNFSKLVSAPLVHVDVINGHNLTALGIHLEETIDRTNKTLNLLKMAAGNLTQRLIDFANMMRDFDLHPSIGYFFILQEFIEAESSQRIIFSGLEWGLPQVTLWTSNCFSQTFLKDSISGQFHYFDAFPETWQYLPIGEFMLKMNSSGTSRCGSAQTFATHLEQGVFNLISMNWTKLNVGFVIDGKHFVRGGFHYLILVPREGPIVVLKELDSRWLIHQTIAGGDVETLEVKESRTDGVVLALASNATERVYRWIGRSDSSQFVPVTSNHGSRRWHAVAWAGHFLASLSRSRHRTLLRIYHYDEREGLDHFQTLSTKNATTLTGFTVGDEVYFAVGSTVQGTTSILQKRGINRFQTILELRTPRVVHLTSGLLGPHHLLLGVASEAEGQSRLLQASFHL